MPVTDPGLIEAVNQSRERFEAKEFIRQFQQGRGNPIIAAKWNEHQFVAVGGKLMFSKGWNTFVDFLGHYIVDKLTPEWGIAEIAKPLEERHTIMQWYDEVRHIENEAIKEPGKLRSMDMKGVLVCYFGLAYALYLLEHNVELQSRMIARLKDRSNFQGAYYELLVARILITAGFELTLEDENDRMSKHCEFGAVSKDTGAKFAIEAKMRSVAGILGKNHTDGTLEKKSGDPISHLAPHLHAAMRKPADGQRMIFIDLNAEMAADVCDANKPTFIDAVNRRLARYEKLQLEQGKTAYVFVTNMTFHRHLLDRPQIICNFGSVGIPDYNSTGVLRLSEMYRRDQKHADALRVGQGIKNLVGLPTTFDGSLPSVTLNGEGPPVQIGQKYTLEGVGPGGMDIIGEVIDVSVNESVKEALVLIRNDKHGSCVVKEPMTDTQLADYRTYKDAYFGKVKPMPKDVTTPYEMFLSFMKLWKDLKRERLLELMELIEEDVAGWSDEDILLERCERLVSGMFKVVDGLLTDEPI